MTDTPPDTRRTQGADTEADMWPDSTRPWVLTRMLVTVRRAIDQAGARGMGRTEIYRMLHDQISSAELDTLTGHLLASGHYERETARTAGRPVTVYRRLDASAPDTSRQPMAYATGRVASLADERDASSRAACDGSAMRRAEASPAPPAQPAEIRCPELRTALAGVLLNPAETRLVGELDRAGTCCPLAALIIARSAGREHTVTAPRGTR